MFEVLVYLVENYFDDRICPDPDALELKLKAAGFESEEIGDAMTWLAGLGSSESSGLPEAFAERASFRTFAPSEEGKLSIACRGLLQFLQSTGVIDPLQRELIIDRSLAVPDGLIDIGKLKIIALVVLWSTGAQPNALVFDELMAGRRPEAFH